MDIGRRLHLVYQQPEAAQPPEEFGVIYNRISTSGQEDGTSLETQLENNTHMAGLVGVPVAPEHIINEVWSGADPSRSGFTRVREFVSNGVVQHVFVNDTDRLARDPWHVIEFIRFCKDHGATLHFSDGTTVETVLDEALQYFKGLFGFQEREKIAARTMLGKVATARAGRMPNGTGRGPFGYDYDKVSKTRSINEAEASIVRLMFEWALGGADVGRINNLRLGESLLLGRETLHRAPIEGLHTDAITLVAEVIESKVKPAQPWGAFAQTAFGDQPRATTSGRISQTILAIGRQDTDPGGLQPSHGLKVLGASSDHLIADAGRHRLAVGTEVTFQLNYSALMSAMTSPFVDKVVKAQCSGMSAVVSHAANAV